MIISCTQENLNQGLFVVSHVAAKNNALPILNNILLQAHENSIKLSATDLEIGITCTIRGKVEHDGEFTIQSRLFADYVNLLPKERVDLSVDEKDEQVLAVSCKNYKTKIKGQPATDFPVIPLIEHKRRFSADYQALRRAISRVIFAVSASETRPEINGVLFIFSDKKLTLAATDSYRLAETSIPVQGAGAEQRVIVPSKTLHELQRILGSLKDPAAISEIKEVEFFMNENQILFSFGGIELVSRLVEGQYPDYQQIIPRQFPTKAVLKTSELVNAVKTASLFARSGIYDINISCDNQRVIISSGNTQLGENKSELTGELSGPDNDIIVNYRYLLDGLQALDTPNAVVNIIGADNPCVLKPAEGTGDEYVYIVMPIKKDTGR